MVAAYLLYAFPVTSSGVFPIIQLDEDFNEASIIVNIYNPPNILKNCQNVTSDNISCSHHFTLLLPQWIDIADDGLRATIHEPKRFLLYHPQTNAAQYKDCRKFSPGGGYDVKFSLSKHDNQLNARILKHDSMARVPVQWNQEEAGANCYIYDLPIYNPAMVDKDKTKFYPFDSYLMQVGFSIPYQTDFQGLVIIPEQFIITSIDVNTSKGITTLTENIGYFNLRLGTDEDVIFKINYGRIVDFGSKVLVGFIFIFLILILTLFFIKSSNPEAPVSYETRIKGYYVGVIPLFISMLVFLKDKPQIFTLFDAVMALSVILLTGNILKDFSTIKFIQHRCVRIVFVIAIFLVIGFLWIKT